MTEAIYVHVRYDVPNEKGKTRRERNEAFEYHSPAKIIPLEGLYLWNWYFEISSSLRRVIDGVCVPISPAEFIAWKQATGVLVRSREYQILQAMDKVFCSTMNDELADYRTRKEEEQKRELEAARAKGGRRGR